MSTINVPINSEELDKKLPISSLADHEHLYMNTVTEGTVSSREIERLEHEKMREYLLKYGYHLTRTVADK